ncbi:MAG: DUF2523 domain-containing protein [Inoviridae sp.]|jgi:hypothetical protein|nr:MAG: DUF2523 domain-containing protein [Inoviridae sp.]
MPYVLGIILTSIISSLLARVLLGAGLTLLTFPFVSELLDSLIQTAETNINQLPAFALSFLKLLEIDKCLSIILSAVQVLIYVKLAKVIVGVST